MNKQTLMTARQAPLISEYKTNPDAAQINDYAKTSCATIPADQPLHAEVHLTHNQPYKVDVGVHTAVGGDSDFPTPGDILCGALASCLDSTIRIIANKMGVPLIALAVEVSGNIDIRGTLRIDDSVPVAFQSFDINVDIKVPSQVGEKIVPQIIKAAEHSCVILQTLRGTPETSINTEISSIDIASDAA